MGIEVEYDTVIRGQMEKARARYKRYNQGPKRKGQNRPKREKPYILIGKLSPEKAEKMRSWKRNEKRRSALRLFTARNEERDCLSQFQQKVDDAHNFAISNDVGASSIQLLKELSGIANRQPFCSTAVSKYRWTWCTRCL